MLTNVDDMTAEDPPRRRWVVATIALVVPLALIVGSAAWFFRSYVMPPSMTIAPLAFSPAVAPETPAPPAPSETTGAAAPVEPPASEPAPSPPPQPQFRYTTNSAEVWAAVPLPGPPRTVETPPEPELTTSSIEPINGPVPLPPRRPHLSNQDAAVPIPRPRPN
jgi:hypothetical protein